MKRVLRRTVSVLCALALTASCLTASMFVSAATDLADSGTAFVDSVHGSNASAPTTLNNGNYSDRWQSNRDLQNSESYFGIAWEEPQTFDTINVYWEASYPVNVTLYIATSPAVLGDLESRFEGTKDEGTTAWEPLTVTNSTRGTGTGGDGKGKDDSFTFAAVTAYAVKVVGTTFNGGISTNNMSAYEIDIYDYSVSGKPYDLTKINTAVNYVNKAFGTSNSYGYSDASWAAFDAARTDAATACDGQVVGTVEGYATQEDVDALATALYTAAASLTGNGSATTNVMENGIAIYNTSDMQGFAAGHHHRVLTDGDAPDNNVCWQPNSWSTSVYLKLANAADMNEVVLFAESTNEVYSIEYTTADVTNVTDVAGIEALSWTDTGATREYAVSYAANTANTANTAYQFYTFDTASAVTAIKLTCTTSNNGYAKLREVEAYYDVEGANTTLSAPTSFSSDGQQFFAVAVDQKDTEGGVLEATYTIRKNGGEPVTRTVTVDTAYAAVSLGGTLITAEEVGGHSGDYVTGILFTGLDSAATYDISVEFGLNG